MSRYDERQRALWCSEPDEHTEPLPRSRWGRFDGPGRYAVYSLYDHEGELLYVGVTGDLASRMSNRRRLDEWYTQVCHWRTEVERFATADEAGEREHALIVAKAPRHNIDGVTRTYVPYGGSRPPVPAPEPLPFRSPTLRGIAHHSRMIRGHLDSIADDTRSRDKLLVRALREGESAEDIISALGLED